MIVETTAVDQWGYLVGILMLALLWTALFVARHDLHRRMLTMSLILVPLAPLGQFYYLQDYWKPPVILPFTLFGKSFGGAVDLLFSFVMGGLATTVYPVLSRRYPIAGLHKPRRWVAPLFIGIEGTSVVLLTNVCRLNSIFSSSIGFVLTALVIVWVRRDLVLPALTSGLISGVALAGVEAVLSFIVPLYLSRYWLLFNTPWGILLLDRVPLTEALWGAAFGLITGVVFDAFEGLTLVSRHQVHDTKGSRFSGALAPSDIAH
jgi:hypothetical protein